MKAKSLYIFFSIFLVMVLFIHLTGLTSCAQDPIILDALCDPVRNEDPNIPTILSSLDIVITIGFLTEAYMDTDTTKAAFHFYDDEGIDLKDNGVLDLNGSVLTFTPSLLQKGIIYEVRIEPTAENIEGRPLDGDGDGTGGEVPDDIWVMKLIIDGVSLWSEVYDTSDGLTANIIRGMAVDNQNLLWVGTWSDLEGGKICYFNGDVWTENSPPVNPFHIRDIFCMVVDNEGSLWTGLDIQESQDDPNSPILAKLENNTWQTLSAKDLNNPGDIKDIAVDSENNIWMITSFSGVIKYTNNEVIKYTTLDPPIDFMRSILIDNDDTIWIGTVDSGIWKVDAGNSWYNSYAQLAAFSWLTYQINDTAADSSGNIWVGTNNGLLKLDVSGENWSQYTIANGLPDDYINTLSIDPNNKILWVGTSAGLGKFSVTGENGVAYTGDNASDISGEAINALTLTSRGEVWFGTDWGLQLRDEISPYITDKNCSSSQLDFYLNDDGSGIDPNSIEVVNIKVNNEDVTWDLNDIEEIRISNNSYHIVYTPFGSFLSNEVITITLTAKDSVGNLLSSDFQFAYNPGDQDPPYIADKSCSLNQLVLYVNDDGSGIDPNSIEVINIRVNNEDVTWEINEIEVNKISNNRYQIIFTPLDPFPKDASIMITIAAEDLAGNSLNPSGPVAVQFQTPGDSIDLSGSGCFINGLKNRISSFLENFGRHTPATPVSVKNHRIHKGNT